MTPRVHGDVVAAVFVGGCVGGWARHGLALAWDSTSAFPWPVLTANLVGAFLLAVVVVVATEARPSRHLRPLLGTGFCGALTTFSIVVVGTARLASGDRWALAATYLAATVVGGLLAAALGLALARLAFRRHPRRTA